MTATTSRGEFDWIRRINEVLGSGPLPGGLGEDAATVVDEDGVRWVWTIDSLVEAVHFRFDWLDAGAVGHRALAASVSDLAAMGAEPAAALVSVAGPAESIERHLERIYEGVAELSASASCPIVGGDLARGEGPLNVTVSALGRPVGDVVLTRDAARPEQDVWVTGRLGGPAAAIALLCREGATAEVRSDASYHRLAWPTPRHAETRWLIERLSPAAAIDLSDGLSGDSRHVAEASGVKVVIEPERVPIHPAAVSIAHRLGVDPLDYALHGGEEFELLLTAPAGALDAFVEPFANAFRIPLTRIGVVVEGSGVWLAGAGGESRLEPLSWDHFGEPLRG